jgi:ESS family glutamate:Na+ symporter
METFYFWDSEVWGIVNLVSVLLITMLVANILKKSIPFFKKSLIPTSVLGGLILFIISAIYESIAKKPLFDTSFFGKNGSSVLEIITYHALALGFIATTLKTTEKKFTKKPSQKKSRNFGDKGNKERKKKEEK